MPEAQILNDEVAIAVLFLTEPRSFFLCLLSEG
jgi:hypothetical protein